MIRSLLATLLLAVVLMVPALAPAAPLDDLPIRDSNVTENGDVSHAAVTLDARPADAAPIGTSPMLASVGVLGVAGLAAGKSLLSYRPGDRVTYVDEAGVAHAALVKHWWGEDAHAACNLTYVDADKRTHDVNSVSRGNHASPGRYWQPDSEPVAGSFEPCCDPGPSAIPAPPPVNGYRQLTPEDIALMNEVKAAVNALGAVLDKLAAHPDTDKRAVSIAKTEAQTASMWAARSITKPSSFA